MGYYCFSTYDTFIFNLLMKKINIGITGCLGRMGKEIIRSIKNKIETYSGLSPDIQNTELRELKRIFKKYFGHLGYEWKDINNSLIKTYDRIKLKEIK